MLYHRQPDFFLALSCKSSLTEHEWGNRRWEVGDPNIQNIPTFIGTEQLLLTVRSNPRGTERVG